MAKFDSAYDLAVHLGKGVFSDEEFEQVLADNPEHADVLRQDASWGPAIKKRIAQIAAKKQAARLLPPPPDWETEAAATDEATATREVATDATAPTPAPADTALTTEPVTEAAAETAEAPVVEKTVTAATATPPPADETAGQRLMRLVQVSAASRDDDDARIDRAFKALREAMAARRVIIDRDKFIADDGHTSKAHAFFVHRVADDEMTADEAVQMAIEMKLTIALEVDPKTFNDMIDAFRAKELRLAKMRTIDGIEVNVQTLLGQAIESGEITINQAIAHAIKAGWVKPFARAQGRQQRTHRWEDEEDDTNGDGDTPPTSMEQAFRAECDPERQKVAVETNSSTQEHASDQPSNGRPRQSRRSGRRR